MDLFGVAATDFHAVNQFWCYFTPLLGAYVADEYLGRYKTIHVAVFIDIIGHIILTISAIPQVITNPDGAMACFAIGLLIMGIGTGCFKFVYPGTCIHPWEISWLTKRV